VLDEPMGHHHERKQRVRQCAGRSGRSSVQARATRARGSRSKNTAGLHWAIPAAMHHAIPPESFCAITAGQCCTAYYKFVP
jgi:hypothetical protein